MEQALTRLGELAATAGHTLTLVIVGGAAMVLRYNARLSTQDVGAFFVTPPERSATRAWAGVVAAELGLPADWLNDGAKGFMQGVSYGPLLIDAPGMQVYQVRPEQLLAMKLSAWRSQQDIDDAATVLAELVTAAAEAMVDRDDFRLRLLVQAWLREQPDLAALPQPETDDPRLLIAAAALVELPAQRTHQQPPAWTVAVGALPEPFFVMRRAERPGFTRDLCLAESPEPLRRRNIFAPPNFLEMV